MLQTSYTNIKLKIIVKFLSEHFLKTVASTTFSIVFCTLNIPKYKDNNNKLQITKALPWQRRGYLKWVLRWFVIIWSGLEAIPDNVYSSLQYFNLIIMICICNYQLNMVKAWCNRIMGETIHKILSIMWRRHRQYRPYLVTRR